MSGRLLPLCPMIGHSSAGTIHNPLQGLSWLWLAEAKNEQLLPGQAGKQSTTWSMLSWPVIKSQVQAHAGCSLACSKLLLAPATGPSLFLSPISLFGAVTCSARASGVKKVCNIQAPDRQALPGHQRAHPQRAPDVQDLLPDVPHVDHNFQDDSSAAGPLPLLRQIGTRTCQRDHRNRPSQLEDCKSSAAAGSPQSNNVSVLGALLNGTALSKSLHLLFSMTSIVFVLRPARVCRVLQSSRARGPVPGPNALLRLLPPPRKQP